MYIKSAPYLHQNSVNLALNEVFFLMLLSQIAPLEGAAPASLILLIDLPQQNIFANKVP